MSHREQRQFCKAIKRKYPLIFKNANVIDVGSLDINGNNKELWGWFSKPNYYLGVDIVLGKNVDAIGHAHEVLPDLQPFIQQMNKDKQHFKKHWPIDIVICTEMLEHDRYWDKSLRAMYNVLRPGGLLLITAGGDGRPEHGTSAHHPDCSPGTNDYYKNISNDMFESVLDRTLFSDWFIRQDKRNNDFQFAGIKKVLKIKATPYNPYL
jgi:SAM-dependent methyltransferase